MALYLVTMHQSNTRNSMIDFDSIRDMLDVLQQEIGKIVPIRNQADELV